MKEAGETHMSTQRDILSRLKKILSLNQFTIIILVLLALAFIVLVIYLSQSWVEQGSLPPFDEASPLEQYQIAKLAAEIRQIRSDTSGSLFWLKLIALFVTVGGAVGGYLIGQSQTTKKRIAFEDRKNVDSAYQSIVKDLSDDKSILLRAAAAVNLGALLKSFPSEWSVSDVRKVQLIQLTKQVLAASLAIEQDPKVLKTLTIALALHRPWKDDPAQPGKEQYGDVREVDLSRAKAVDAYWAKVDFTYSDFYQADLSEASFRRAILKGAQFRQSDLTKAVLIDADCTEANFKLADLRHANLSGATLTSANFDGTKVNGCVLKGAELGDNPSTLVDNSVKGDGSEMMSVQEWFQSAGQSA
jgi:uncharacterized protein YjbI with pentapeptide repeats